MAKILVIDDEGPILANIVRLFRLEGFEVFSATDGARGLALAGEERPDLVICDLRMPELDGYGVLAGLRANAQSATTPLIFLTASAEKDRRAASLALGASEYLTKPFDSKELLAVVRSLLANRESRHE
jgi:DNA-binding response OmpR family regulator